MRFEFSINIIGQETDVIWAEDIIGKKADRIKKTPAKKNECIATYEFKELADVDASDAMRLAINHVTDIFSKVNLDGLFSMELWCVMHSDSEFAGCWIDSTEMNKLSTNKIDLVLSFYAFDEKEL